jgi:hypothetical protein
VALKISSNAVGLQLRMTIYATEGLRHQWCKVKIFRETRSLGAAASYGLLGGERPRAGAHAERGGHSVKMSHFSLSCAPFTAVW